MGWAALLLGWLDLRLVLLELGLLMAALEALQAATAVPGHRCWADLWLLRGHQEVVDVLLGLRVVVRTGFNGACACGAARLE